MRVRTIDCDYFDTPGVAAAYLLVDGEQAAFVEANTNRAVPLLLAALEAEGLAPEQVRYVICTHIHLDHAGGAGVLMEACRNAQLLLHPKAAPHAIDPSRIVAGATEVYGEEKFRALYGAIRPVEASRVTALEDGATVDFGTGQLRFLHTRGHANHHFCVRAGRGIFTGDSFGIVYPALQDRGLFAFATTTPTDFDAEAALASVDRILDSGAEVAWLTHFGEQSDMEGIARALRRQLPRYAAIIDEADPSGREGVDLDAWCELQVRALFEEELARHGLTDHPALGLLELDIGLNAQGIAFAVKKRRYKRSG